MQKMISALKDRVSNALIADRDNHIYRCHRSIFTDEQLFNLEMKYIFCLLYTSDAADEVRRV